MQLAFLDKVPAAERNFVALKVQALGQKYGVDPNFIMLTFFKESSMNPKAQNQNTGATGIIQFMPETAQKLFKVPVSYIKKLSFSQQLPLVEKYWDQFKPFIKNGLDFYFTTFYPLALRKADDYVLGSEISPQRVQTISRQNPAFAKEGKVTKGNVKKHLLKVALKHHPQIFKSIILTTPNFKPSYFPPNYSPQVETNPTKKIPWVIVLIPVTALVVASFLIGFNPSEKISVWSKENTT